MIKVSVPQEMLPPLFDVVVDIPMSVCDVGSLRVPHVSRTIT
jgi:hypothetical protein